MAEPMSDQMSARIASELVLTKAIRSAGDSPRSEVLSLFAIGWALIAIHDALASASEQEGT